jgi:hypothetical protein
MRYGGFSKGVASAGQAISRSKSAYRAATARRLE